MSWTEERVERLTKLWADGLSASQIAGELGNVTRNAVIGKVHRLGLSGRAKPTRTSAPRPRKSRTGGMRPQRGGYATIGNAALKADEGVEPVARPRPQPAPLVELVIPVADRKTLLQLSEATCKWPIGDPTAEDFYFCGRHSEPGSGPYCEHHARVAYQPLQDRRRERRQQARLAGGK